MVISDSVIPTVAMASAPSLATKNMSTTAKMASIIISITIGTASRNIALLILPLVKSCSVPAIASLRAVNNVLYLCKDFSNSDLFFKFNLYK